MPNGPILLIDDCEDFRVPLQMMLEEEGYSVVCAGDGLEGLEELERGTEFALILLDLSMPRLDGRQFLEEAAKRGLGREIPVLLLSAGGSDTDHPSGPNVIGFISKPIRFLELVRRLKDLVEAHGGPQKKSDPFPAGIDPLAQDRSHGT